MEPRIAGTWRLKTWRRFEEDGSVFYPFGEDACGILIYSPDGHMAVQMLASERPLIETDDALGGSEQQRAAAYSSCLAYFGTYEVRGQSVVHKVAASLFPNWSNTVQERPFVRNGQELVLQVTTEDGRITNEIVWERESSDQ